MGTPERRPTMAVTLPPTDERAADGLPLGTPESPPLSSETEATQGASPSPPIAPPPPPFGPPEQPARRQVPGDRILWPLILIALGTVFLIGNYVANLGSLLFLALGVAFLVARVVQREYGFAVPAGILLGFGTF